MSDGKGTRQDQTADGSAKDGGADKRAPAGEAQLGQYIAVNLRQPLSELDRPTAKAYAASDSRTPTQSVYALVCESAVPPRQDALQALARISGVQLMTPIDWGPIQWDDTGERRFAVCFDRPVDPVLAAAGQARVPPMREDQLVARVLRPIFRCLRELNARGLTHRAFSAENIYGQESGAGAVLLGECASAPAGMAQPAVYHTIDGAQALPAGRGHGTIADDLYALGVLIAVLLRGGDPFAGVETREMIAQKIDRGSYAALLGQSRVSLTLMEPLRGLLCDRVDERWTMQQLENWLNGRRQSPKQASLPIKARRAFTFQGKDYWNGPALAHALATNWDEALRALSSGDLARWAERSLGDDKQGKLVTAALATAQAGDGGDDRTLARTLIGLDPAAPIRLRGFAARLDSLAQVLAVEFDDRDRRNAFVEVLRSKLPQRWLESQSQQRTDHPQAVQQFDRMLWYIEREQPGFGIERVLYEFNPGWPCQSALLSDAFVSEMEDLLPALERRAGQDIPDKPPIDRHIAAYCGANMKPPPDRLIQGLGDSNAANRAQAMVAILADIQRRYGPTQLPTLCEWMARHLAPLTDSLHNREVREKVQRRIQRAVKSGSLAELRAAAADNELRRRDAKAFENAKRHYTALAREIAWLEDGGLTSDASVTASTRNVATVVSAIGSGLIMVAVALFYAT
jgi:hypothetical protein